MADPTPTPLTDVEALARVVWAGWPMPAMSEHDKPMRWEDDYPHMHRACLGIADALLDSDWLADALTAARIDDERERVLAILDQPVWTVRDLRAALALTAWPCDNYRAPLTCLTAPSSETGRCGHCRAQEPTDTEAQR